MEKAEQDIFSQIPSPPEGSVFKLSKVQNVSLPHPFMITPKHVAYASDHCGGMLDKRAMAYAPCGIKGCQLSIDEHETNLTLFIAVPQNKDLNLVPGLHAYLLSIKDLATSLGVQGFAFPKS